MNEAAILVEINGIEDVRGDDLIVLKGLGDAVNLDGELHRDSGTRQSSGEADHSRRSPAVAEQKNGSLAFSFVRQSVIRESGAGFPSQVAEDGFVGFADFAIFEKAEIDLLGIFAAESVHHLNLGMIGGIASDKASHEAYDDYGRSG